MQKVQVSLSPTGKRRVKARSRQKKHRGEVVERKNDIAQDSCPRLQQHENCEQRLSDLEKAFDAVHGRIRQLEVQLENRNIFGEDTSLCPSIIARDDPLSGSTLSESSEPFKADHSSNLTHGHTSGVSALVAQSHTESSEFMRWSGSTSASMYLQYCDHTLYISDEE
jgi:hypothetical protein